MAKKTRPLSPRKKGLGRVRKIKKYRRLKQKPEKKFPGKKTQKKKTLKKKAVKKKILKKKVSRKRVLRKKKLRERIETPYPVHSPKIRVIGIGGGGSSIINEIAPQTKRISFVAVNTDLQALKKLSKKVRRFSFGQKLTHGLGTGMNPKLGELVAQNEKEKIKNLISGQDLCLLVSCLGGGTGSGATPLFAKIAKDFKILTLGIFTLPFRFEGTKKMKIAKRAIIRMKNDLNAFSIIPNQRIFKIIDQKTPLKKALSALNKILTENLKGLIEFVYWPGLINIDFADLKSILEGRGKVAYLSCVKTQGKDRIAKAVEKVANSPLYKYGISGADRILFNIVGGDDLKMTEVEKISQSIYKFNPRAKIIFGVSQYLSYKNKIKITLLSVSLGLTKEQPAKPEPKPKPTPQKPKKPKKSRVARLFPPKPKKTKKITVLKQPKPEPKKVKKKKIKPITKVKKTKPLVFSEKPKKETKPKRKRKLTSKPKKKKVISKSSVKKIKPKKLVKKPVLKKKAEMKKPSPAKTQPSLRKAPKIVKNKPPIKKVLPSPQPPKIKITKSQLSQPPLSLLPTAPPSFNEDLILQKQREKVRKNALDLKRETEQLEKEIERQERKWDIPAFLRRKR